MKRQSEDRGQKDSKRNLHRTHTPSGPGNEDRPSRHARNTARIRCLPPLNAAASTEIKWRDYLRGSPVTAIMQMNYGSKRPAPVRNGSKEGVVDGRDSLPDAGAEISDLPRRRLLGARLKLDPLRGVDVHTIDVENPVEMRSGGAARGTGVAQNVAALDLCTCCDDELRHVKIRGLKALAVVNADRIAENVEFLRERDVACGDGADGFAGRGALVHAAVILAGRLP